MRVGVYLRYSSDRQSPSSLEDQRRLCGALAERNNWTVAGIYQDAAITGSLKDRKGCLSLVADAHADKFDLVVAESLDRLNRDLEEAARLYKRLKFVGVGIHTVSEVHVSITGLMGEMYLKSLAEKTRRGVEGRVLAGQSGGGKCYGYDVVDGVNAAGAPITGERKVNPAEAVVVREIFRRFAAGEGSRVITRTLNERSVPGPFGRPWGDTTIRGHAKRGTGLLNNELYRGRLVWGRQRYIKDPATGRRVARLNPAGAETLIEMPHLRIVDDEFWEAVKVRQAEVSRPLTDPHTTTPLNDAHRPRLLLSGLLTCGLRSSLITPDLVAEFVAEYTAEWNRLQGERRSKPVQRDRKLLEVRRKIDGIVTALEKGIITPTTKERLEALEAEKGELERSPVEVSLPSIHPNLAERYRVAVAQLEDMLADQELAAEAKSVLRNLIKTIKVFPGAKGREVELELHGELAAILSFAQGAKIKARAPISRIQVSVVAEACNHLDLQLQELLRFWCT